MRNSFSTLRIPRSRLHDMYIDAGHCGRPVYDAMMILFDIVDDAEIAAKLHSLE